MKFLIILAITCSFLMPSVFAESDITIMTDSDSYEYGEIVKITGKKIISSGSYQRELLLILNGTASVERENVSIAYFD